MHAAEIVAGTRPRAYYGVIVCALRYFTEGFSSYYRDLFVLHGHEPATRVFSHASVALVMAALHARDECGARVVALDIAGPEKGHAAAVHTEVRRRASAGVRACGGVSICVCVCACV